MLRGGRCDVHRVIVRTAALVALAGGVVHADDDPPSPHEVEAAVGYGRSFYTHANDMAPVPELGVIANGQLLVRFEP